MDDMEDLREGPDYRFIAEKAGYMVSDYEDNPELWYYYRMNEKGESIIMGEDFRCPLDAWEAACLENGLLENPKKTRTC